jgi:glycerate kinase
MLGQSEPWEGAQTTLHALLEDDVPNHSGAGAAGGAGVAALKGRAHLRVALIAR